MGKILQRLNLVPRSNSIPVWMLEAKQSRLVRYLLARCYSMAASLKQVNKTSLRYGITAPFHRQDEPYNFNGSLG